MIKTTLCAGLLGATALVPLAADSHADRAVTEFGAAAGLAIAAQGNEALRTIRHEAWANLASQKPAPLDALIRVRREAVPEAPALET